MMCQVQFKHNNNNHINNNRYCIDINCYCIMNRLLYIIAPYYEPIMYDINCNFIVPIIVPIISVQYSLYIIYIYI